MYQPLTPIQPVLHGDWPCVNRGFAGTHTGTSSAIRLLHPTVLAAIDRSILFHRSPTLTWFASSKQSGAIWKHDFM